MPNPVIFGSVQIIKSFCCQDGLSMKVGQGLEGEVICFIRPTDLDGGVGKK